MIDLNYCSRILEHAVANMISNGVVGLRGFSYDRRVVQQ